MKIVSLFVLIAVVIFACQKVDKKADSTETTTENTAKGEIIAEVNGTPVLLDEFKKKYMRSAHYNPDKYKTIEGKKEILQDIIDFELLYQEAQKKNLEDSEQIKRMMVRSLLRQELNVAPKITNEELKAYYDSHLEEYEEIRASHILLKTNLPKELVGKTTPDDYKKQQQGKAEALLAQVKKGQDFAELAKKNSEDSTAANGGDLNYFNRKKMVETFSNTAFALKETGEISDIVETRYGFHIIKLTDRRTQDFEKVKGIIRNNLLKDKRKEAHDQFVINLRQQAKININEEKFSSEAEKLVPAQRGQGGFDKNMMERMKQMRNPHMQIPAGSAPQTPEGEEPMGQGEDGQKG